MLLAAIIFSALGVVLGGAGGMFSTPLILRFAKIWSKNSVDRMVIIVAGMVAGAMVGGFLAFVLGQKGMWFWGVMAILLSGLTVPLSTVALNQLSRWFRLGIVIADRTAKKCIEFSDRTAQNILEKIRKKK